MYQYQPKVEQTEKYSDSQGEHIVCRGKLVLIEDKSIKGNQGHTLWKNSNNQLLHTHTSNPNKLIALKPIIISETEKIKVGDYFIDDCFEQIRVCTKKELPEKDGYTYSVFDEYGKRWIKGTMFKILTLPEHFSDKHLQAIVDGKMENKDEVLVKAVPKNYNKESVNDKNTVVKVEYDYSISKVIYLDQQNHITLFPIKQSLEETSEKLLNEVVDAWESLEGGKNYSKRDIEKWLMRDMKPIMDKVRILLNREIPQKAKTEWAKKNY